jgi:hypothetical protein
MRTRTAFACLALLLDPSVALARGTFFNFTAGKNFEHRLGALGPARVLAKIGNWTCVAEEVGEGFNLLDEPNREGTLTCTHTSGAAVSIHAFCAVNKVGYDHVEATIGEPGNPKTEIAIRCQTMNNPS